MHYTGTIYRPPFEARSLLLQVTTGCSHNRCSFCTMYRDEQFGVEPLEQVEADLQEAREYVPNVTRVFLENGDPFVLSADRLEEIAVMVHAYLPKVETIAMYASIKNVIGKTDEELKRLRILGINELNIGVESGLDDALSYMNKGYTAKQAVYELNRLGAAGIDYGANIILGCAGAERRHENAAATATLLNETKPYLIFTGTLHADPGCPLYEDMKNGTFHECTCGQLLDEQELLLSRLELEDTYYFGSHPSNLMPMQGILPKYKKEMINAVREMRDQLREHLDEYPVRSGEGSVQRR